jgi:hypothetical protein
MKIQRAAQQDLNLNAPEGKDPPMECPSCCCQFFEEKRIRRFKKFHTVVHGQNVPPADPGVEFVLLKCIRCGQMVEPELLSGRMDTPAKLYDILLKEIEGR